MKRVRIDKILENTVPDKDILSEKTDDFFPELDADETERITKAGLERIRNGEHNNTDREIFISGTVEKQHKKRYVFPAVAAACAVFVFAAVSLITGAADKNKIITGNENNKPDVSVTEQTTEHTHKNQNTENGYRMERIELPENVRWLSSLNMYNDNLYIEGREKDKIQSVAITTMKNECDFSDCVLDILPEGDDRDINVTDVYYDGEVTYIAGYVSSDEGIYTESFLTKYSNSESSTVFMDEDVTTLSDVSYDHGKNQVYAVSGDKLMIFNADLEKIKTFDISEITRKVTGKVWYGLKAETDSYSDIYLIVQDTDPENIYLGEYAVMKFNSDMECVYFNEYSPYLDDEHNSEFSDIGLSELSNGGVGVFCQYVHESVPGDIGSVILSTAFADVFEPGSSEPERKEIITDYHGRIYSGLCDMDYILSEHYFSDIELRNIDDDESIRHMYCDFSNFPLYIHGTEEVMISYDITEGKRVLFKTDKEGNIISTDDIPRNNILEFSGKGEVYAEDYKKYTIDSFSGSEYKTLINIPDNLVVDDFSSYDNIVFSAVDYIDIPDKYKILVYSPDGKLRNSFCTEERMQVITSRNNGDYDDIYYKTYCDDYDFNCANLKRMNTETGESEEIQAVNELLAGLSDEDMVSYTCSGGAYDIYISVNDTQWYGYSIEDDTVKKIFDAEEYGLQFAYEVTADSEGAVYVLSEYDSVFRIIQ